MMKNSILLLRTLLRSTSQANIFKYTKDKKKKSRVIGNYVGLSVLYLMLMAYCIAMCVGYGQVGIIGSVPVICALTISAMAFFFTIFKTNGYLFNFKEYDMIMSLPFDASTVAGSKFLYMYIQSLPWYLSISVAMLAGYGYYARPFVLVYPVWIILSLLLPIIPMLIAAFIGFLIARVGSGFRKKNMIQTILTFVFIIFCFSLRFILEDMFRNDKVEATLKNIAEITDSAAGIYLPVGWFARGVSGLSILDILLLAGVSVLLFAVVFKIVGGSYRNINSALKSHAAAKNFRMVPQKKRSVLNAIAFKEFKRMTGSTIYMTNVGIGELLAVLLGLITLIFGFDKIVATVTQGAPIDTTILHPAIPFIIYFCIGMVASTACSPSLEGKNLWIMQSLPLETKTIYRGKMLFNMYLTVPFMAFGILCMSISAGVSVVDTLLYLLLGLMLCAFSSAWGCVCGVRHMRLDWENEVEVVKQGTAVALYMLPNMFVVMGLTVLVVFLGTLMNQRILILLFTLIAAILAALSYRRVMVLAKRR